MDGEAENTLDGYLQMAILLYRSYCARTSFCETFLQNILIKLPLAGCLCSKAPLSLALYGVDALHVLALRECEAMWLPFECRNTRI